MSVKWQISILLVGGVLLAVVGAVLQATGTGSWRPAGWERDINLWAVLLGGSVVMIATGLFGLWARAALTVTRATLESLEGESYAVEVLDSTAGFPRFCILSFADDTLLFSDRRGASVRRVAFSSFVSVQLGWVKQRRAVTLSWAAGPGTTASASVTPLVVAARHGNPADHQVGSLAERVEAALAEVRRA